VRSCPVRSEDAGATTRTEIAVTATVTMDRFEAPFESVASTNVEYVPDVAKACETVDPVACHPSPNVQAYEEKAPEPFLATPTHWSEVPGAAADAFDDAVTESRGLTVMVTEATTAVVVASVTTQVTTSVLARPYVWPVEGPLPLEPSPNVQAIVNDGVPREAVQLSATGCPTSRAVAFGWRTTTGAASTVTLVAERAIVRAPSVTWQVMLGVPAAVQRALSLDRPGTEVPFPKSQAKEYGARPPEGLQLNRSDCPVSTTFRTDETEAASGTATPKVTAFEAVTEGTAEPVPQPE
jgi:hypothetical protein